MRLWWWLRSRPLDRNSSSHATHAQTITGTKFIVTADGGEAGLDVFLQAVYELFADYVLKNPFYELEQPITGKKKWCWVWWRWWRWWVW